MRLLALDASSTACGWACGIIADNGSRWDDVRFGVIRPRSKDSLERIAAIVEGVGGLVSEEAEAVPDQILMEWSSGKVHGRIAKASGLSVLGAAQGAVWQALREWGHTVEVVAENTWTRSRPKKLRAKEIELIFPDYGNWVASGVNNRKRDPGFDAADALGLMEWWRGEYLRKLTLERAGVC